MIEKSDIYKAWVIVRAHDSTIPDETLDFIKDSSLKALEIMNKMEDDAYTFSEMVNIPGRYYCHSLGQGIAIEVDDKQVSMLNYMSIDDGAPIRYPFHFRREVLNMNFHKMKHIKDLFEW